MSNVKIIESSLLLDNDHSSLDNNFCISETQRHRGFLGELLLEDTNSLYSETTNSLMLLDIEEYCTSLADIEGLTYSLSQDKCNLEELNLSRCSLNSNQIYLVDL